MTTCNRTPRVRAFAAAAIALGLACFPAYANNDEEAVGRASVARIMGAAPLHASQDLQRYVNLVSSLIASKTDAKQTWRFGVLDTESVNAFAAPGGFVLITSGLLKQLGSEDELAAVLAHEIAHVTRQHHYQAIVRQRNAEAAMKGLQADLGKDGADFAALSKASAVLYARGLDKSTEYEADLIGVQLMTIAGYDPSAHLAVLEKLDGMSHGDPRMALLTSTHPSAKERIDYLVRAGIERLPIPTASAQARTARFNRSVRAVLVK
jgi:predicted Zn-dependent protease